MKKTLVLSAVLALGAMGMACESAPANNAAGNKPANNTNTMTTSSPASTTTTTSSPASTTTTTSSPASTTTTSSNGNTSSTMTKPTNTMPANANSNAAPANKMAENK